MKSAGSQENRLWASRAWLLQNFGMPQRQLDRAVDQGFVRTAKFGEARQAARLYFVPDVERFMMNESAGRTHARVAGSKR